MITQVAVVPQSLYSFRWKGLRRSELQKADTAGSWYLSMSL